MSDSNKTKKELLAEIEALRAKLDGTPSERELDTGSQTKGGITRRDILATAWVAPVILTVPLGASFSQRAQAQVTPMPTSASTSAPPTMTPTNMPTSAPTVPATSAPTLPPTSGPVTAPPTAFPTAAANVIPVEISDFDVS